MNNELASASPTIVAVPLSPKSGFKSLCLDRHAEDQQIGYDPYDFKIRFADSKGRRSSASMLINKMYSWRGYQTGELISTPNQITLVANIGDQPVGTLTLSLDSPSGLLADELYRDAIDAVRQEKRFVCELIKLAVDQNASSKQVLATIFHIAYIYGRLIRKVTDLLIEVNPRHVNFYKRMLGFVQIGEERQCPRVDAPAVLLRLDLDYTDEQIRLHGGKTGQSQERSLYPYFFSLREQEGILGRLQKMED